MALVNDQPTARWGLGLGTGVAAACLLLPVLVPGGSGLLSPLLPLPVLFFLARRGRQLGGAIVRNAVLVALGVGALLGSLAELAVSFLFLPLGMLLYQAGQAGRSVSRTLFEGALLLAVLWLAMAGVFAAATGQNPYIRLLEVVDQELEAGYTAFTEAGELPPEMVAAMAQARDRLQVVLPRLLPAILAASLLVTVFANLVLGNWLLGRGQPAGAPWPPFTRWRLPEGLIWLLIAGGSLVILPHPELATVGHNLLVVTGVLYFLQGLAVAGFLLGRWRLPRPVKIVIYLVLLVEAYGMLLFAALGVIDVWADFRNRSRPDQPAF
ncbi:MAG: DUF2232 domain-containing protein [Thermodesulfobacteriota bacterium]